MLISNNKNTMYDNLKNSINNSDEIIINVSFIRDSGLKLLIPELLKAKENGKKIKILTSDYMKVTEPNALYRLLNINGVKLFKNPTNKSFHPKTYIFKKNDNVEIYVGSSNISYSALITGVEWNYYFSGKSTDKNIQNILEEFEELYNNCSFNLSLEWLRKYEKSYEKKDFEQLIDPVYFPTASLQNGKEIEPIKFQIPALYELSKTREEGYKKAMVIVGTGLGKTYLSAFDSMSFKKILFIAHRDEILRDAQKSFENVYKNSKTYGFFNGYKKDTGKDITFSSVNTLCKDKYLREQYFLKDYFDYIVVDEFHHSTSKSYLKILNYFNPKFLLGLTATPERSDNGDVYKLCDYNIAYECDFKVGINNGWLTPFEYFGIYDETDYSEIPWKNNKYDLEILENKLIIDKRMETIYKKYLDLRKTCTIGFCVTVKHCNSMNEYFKNKKIKSEIIVGDTPIEKRQEIIQKFKLGLIEVIFTVDVFNEGIDIPNIDTLLFLRPTSSYTIFIQQLGRGLRTYKNKNKLRVLDFVGNYKGAELKPNFLLGNPKNKIKSPLEKDFILPVGCSASFDFKIIEYFEKSKKQKDNISKLLLNDYIKVAELITKKPSIMDIYTFGEYPVHLYLQKYKTWYNFLQNIKELSIEQKLFSEKAVNFLEFLEKTLMTKSYKMPLFLAVFENGFNQKTSLEEIGIYYQNFYQNELHLKDINDKNIQKWNLENYKQLAKDKAINFLTKHWKKYYLQNTDFFKFEEEFFIIESNLANEIINNKELLLNILDRLNYRNSNYFRRKYMEK